MYTTFPGNANASYAVNPQQAEGNVQFVLGQIATALQQLSSKYPPQIITTAMNLINRPDSLQRIRNDVINIYGGVAVSQRELFDYVLRKCANVCQEMLTQAQFSNGYQGYYGAVQPTINGFGQGMMGVAQQNIYPTQGFTPSYQQSYQNVGDDMGSIYGTSARRQQSEMTSPYAPNIQNPQATFENNNAQVQKTRINTGKPYDISLGENDDVIFGFEKPEWKEVDTKDVAPIIDPNVMTLGKLWAIEAKNQKIKAATVRVKEPVDNTDSVIVDIASNAKNLFHVNENEKFAHVIEFDEIRVCRSDFDSSKKFFDECVKIWNADKTNSVSTVVKVLSLLQEQGDFGRFMGRVLLEKFNKAASVNFLKKKAVNGREVIVKLNPLSTIAELSRLLTDSGDSGFDHWKENQEDFATALGLTLKASFNRIFKKGNYLNPYDVNDRIAIMGSHNTGLRFGSKKQTGIQILASTPNSEEQTKELNGEINLVLNSVFCLKVENRILVHNLDLPEVKPQDFSAIRLENSTESLVMLEFLNKFGNLELLDINDQTQSSHPLELGMDYLARLLVRRQY